MRLLHPNAEAIATEYIGKGVPIGELGWGVGGAVFSVPSRNTAIKVHKGEENYENEVRAYRRLRQRKVVTVCGLSVPQFIRCSDKLHIIEMSIVGAPYLLDFAHARLDSRPDFGDDQMAMWWQMLAERFESNFGKVQDVYYELVRRCRLYYLDFKPGNIEFGSVLPR